MLMDGAFAAGLLVSIITIAIQAVATVCVIKTVRFAARHFSGRRKIETLVIVMAASGTLLTIFHLLEVAVWAQLYAITGATDPDNIYYFAFVNFTTLGYGDLIPARPWRILGPMTAANGMLLFGWSTAVLFSVLSRAIAQLRIR
ncbi:potassium channel family protein [Xanthobacter autotrophicus]|uniref:potassium channel family protein n=1 Tax=Xanthobacter autotrophicus TaxID=280 RepID=UPI001E6472C0|nr:potassium channel family protein [Xanthobacter autotrophicus]UDQ90059.1 potassium channel family protein [Xanthobacter autotrophicus]